MKKLFFNNYYSCFAFFYLVALLNGLFFYWLSIKYNFTSDNNLSKFGKTTQLFIMFLFAPIIETLLFQTLPVEIVKSFYPKSKFLTIFICGCVFGIMHYYHLIYFFMAFIGGLILGTFYLFTEKKGKSAIIYTSIFHSLYNLFGYLFVN